VRNKGEFVRIRLLLGIVTILTGCATTAKVSQVKVSAPEKIETFQLSPLALEVLDETKGEKNQKFVELAEKELKVELSKNEIQVEKEAEKTLRVSIKNIKHISPARRFIPVVGLFGQSTVDADVSLLDKDGASLAEFKISSMAGIRGALFELDAIERITRKLAQEIVSKLKSLKVQE